MPKGIYTKSYLHRKTDKFKQGMTILRAHEPDFQMKDITTNEDVYIELAKLGFRYVDGMWFKPRNPNGHTPPLFPLETSDPVIVIKPTSDNHLEMTLSDDQVDTVQEVIEAMHTLGFRVEVRIRGTRE